MGVVWEAVSMWCQCWQRGAACPANLQPSVWLCGEHQVPGLSLLPAGNPGRSHARLVLLTCGTILAPAQRLSGDIALCFSVPAIADEATTIGGGQQQHAGSYWCCSAAAVCLGYSVKISMQSLDKSHLEFA